MEIRKLNKAPSLNGYIWINLYVAIYYMLATSGQAFSKDLISYQYEGWHSASEPSRIKYRVYHDKVVELKNMSYDCDIEAGQTIIDGIIANVNYNNDGISIRNFIIENNAGERSLINVDEINIESIGMNRADLGWLSQGMQEILHKNRLVIIEAKACGASGGFLFLDHVKLKSQSMPTIADQLPMPNSQDADPNSQKEFKFGKFNVIKIPLTEDAGTFKVPVTINEAIKLNFTVDSGASDVSIPADVVLVMMRTGTLSDSDFIGTKTYRIADGSIVPSKTFWIRKLTVGNHTIENVQGSMASVAGSLLLGQSFLSRFSKVSFDYNKHLLMLQ